MGDQIQRNIRKIPFGAQTLQYVIGLLLRKILVVIKRWCTAHHPHTYPYISATDFMDFLRTRNRVRFEDKCFAKRRGLSALVLAECVENKGRFMDDIINGIFWYLFHM